MTMLDSPSRQQMNGGGGGGGDCYDSDSCTKGFKGKGTGSFDKRRNNTHTLCLRCGRISFHLQKSRYSACAFPAARVRKYNCSEKAIRRKTTRTGRMSTPEVYEVAAKPVVMAAMEGINDSNFFSKMVRESSNCSESCIKPLHMALQQFKQWVKPIKPLGVVGAIAAGNSAVLKPSEIAPATSSLLAKLFSKYLDASLVKVIEGSVAETMVLLEHRGQNIRQRGLKFSLSDNFG
ncbi:hypothetical protein ACFE04_026111 [Oxalis oulophora]